MITGILSAYSKRKRYLLHFEFQNSKLRELKNLGPWKLIENFILNILVLHCDKLKSSELLVP